LIGLRLPFGSCRVIATNNSRQPRGLRNSAFGR
jgi:hypothetical protein